MKFEYDVSGLRLTNKQQQLLAPYFANERPDDEGEWALHCPLHFDTTRSASVNINSGKWFCQKGCGGGSIQSLIKRKDDWVDPPNGATSSSKGGSQKGKVNSEDLPTEARVAGWASALLSNKERLNDLKKARGLTTETLKQFEIGWDSRKRGCYTIPVRAPDRKFWNCRKYQLDPGEGRRKMSSVKGMGSPRLYPFYILDESPDYIIICEGEWDAMLLIQEGYHAITRTAGANTWHPEWNELFRDRIVYLAHDADDTGVAANNKCYVHMMRVAKEVRLIKFPYPIEEKHGKDVTDFILEFGGEAFQGLMDKSEILFNKDIGEPEDLDPSDVTILDTFDARQVAKPLRFVSTVMGKSEPGYSIPEKVKLACTQDYGKSCEGCPMKNRGRTTINFGQHEEVNLEMIDAPTKALTNIYKERYGIPGTCNKVKATVEKYRSVEVLHTRPSIDHTSGDGASSHRGRSIVSIGRHDTSPNTTVRVTGALYPSPRSQKNQFLAWGVEPVETSLDNFKLDENVIEQLMMFRPRQGESPLAKAMSISGELSDHVTRIVGRDEMHLFLDLIWHSVLSYRFDGQLIERGWVEGLIMGDTRTGKSEVAKALMHHYRLGEMISCDNASFAGIIGGLQQHGGGGDWTINWGVVPLGDGRLVVLDEVGGLSPEEISRMSSVRSSGIADIAKIQAGRTSARTRLAWLANPRLGTLGDYTYAVDAIPELIGKAEDIARFTFAMAAKRDPRLAERINTTRTAGDLRYTSDACRWLVLWGWSRTVDQVVFTDKAVRAIYAMSNRLGRQYVETPPLIQAANVRTKLASLAASLAVRTFSSDKKFEKVVVKSSHVNDIVKFLNKIYFIDDFGYNQRSKEAIADEQYAQSRVGETRRFLRQKKGLIKLLRSRGAFKRDDVEQVCGVNRNEANAIINHLYDLRMIKKGERGLLVSLPTLHELLRETEIE